jgi:hypothetical protein
LQYLFFIKENIFLRSEVNGKPVPINVSGP